jgi:DNA-binding NarL/FixJ family response regulator
MRILLVEDHRLFRQVLIECLKRHYSDTVFGEAGSGKEAKQQLRSSWDVVLLDLLLPDATGLDLLAYVKGVLPAAKVIVLTGTNECDYGVAALVEGADGFVTKNASYSQVLHSIDYALAGGRYVSQSLAELLLNVHTHRNSTGNILSRRELDILHFVGRGFSGPEIADSLHLSPRTVETYRARVCKKLGVKNSAGLIRFAVARELNSQTPLTAPALSRVD